MDKKPLDISPPHKKICLRAATEEDIPPLSACVQDAIFRSCDSSWQPERHCFSLLLNRFCWEDASSQAQRILSSLRFQGVLRVQAKGLEKCAGGFLHLLAIGFEAGVETPGGQVALHFADDAQIRLEVEALEAELRDIGDAWPARQQPAH